MSTISLVARAAGADARIYEPTPKHRPKPLTAERLRDVFDYNPETGTFTRKIATRLGRERARRGAENPITPLRWRQP